MTIATEFASGASGTSWTNPTNANADDGAYATYTIAAKNTTGNVNTLTNFGFDSSIPSGATINSVALEVQHKVSTTGGIANLECTVAISGTPGTYNTDSAEPTTDTIRTYSSLARPGGGSWTRNDLLDGTFTVLLRARSGNNATSVVYSWDYATVSVDYTIPTQSLTQSSTFTNSNTLNYQHTVTPGTVTLTQSSTFTNSNTLNYQHSISQGSPQTLTQSSRFDNSNTLNYQHTLTPGAVALTQSSRFNNSNALTYAHTLTVGPVALSQSSRFDNSGSFYTHSLSQAGGAQTLTQSARFDNSPTFYLHTLTGGEVISQPPKKHGGIGHNKKRKKDRPIWIEEDGKILVFRSPSDVVNYLNSKKPKTGAGAARKSKKPHEPLIIDLPQIRQFGPRLRLEFENLVIPPKANDNTIDIIIELALRVAELEDDDDVSILLLAA